MDLPEGGEASSWETDDPLPGGWAGQIEFEDFTVYCGCNGPESYAAAGVTFPESVEEYSQRSGPQGNKPADTEYAYDDYGNMFVQYSSDGNDIYYVIDIGSEWAYGFNFYCSEGTIENYNPGLWFSLTELKD